MRDARFNARTASYLQKVTGLISFGAAGNPSFALRPHYLHVVCHRLQPSGNIIAAIAATCAHVLSVRN